MKKVILTALFAFGVGSAQCEKVDLSRDFFSMRSLEDLKRWRDEDFNKIKETLEYERAVKAKADHDITSRLFEYRNSQCESFKKNESRWFSGVSANSCDFAQKYEKLMIEAKEASRDANNELEALITKNHPDLKQLCLNILEKQNSTIDLLEKTAQ